LRNDIIQQTFGGPSLEHWWGIFSIGGANVGVPLVKQLKMS